MLAALRWLRESLPNAATRNVNKETTTDWRTVTKGLSPLLALAVGGQLALTMFEGTFAPFAQGKFDFGPAEVGKRDHGVLVDARRNRCHPRER